MLQKVSVPFVDESICEKSYEADGYAVTDGMICAGGVSGQDACQGDSGGIYEYIKYFGFYLFNNFQKIQTPRTLFRPLDRLPIWNSSRHCYLLVGVLDAVYQNILEFMPEYLITLTGLFSMPFEQC